MIFDEGTNTAFLSPSGTTIFKAVPGWMFGHEDVGKGGWGESRRPFFRNLQTLPEWAFELVRKRATDQDRMYQFGRHFDYSILRKSASKSLVWAHRALAVSDDQVGGGTPGFLPGGEVHLAGFKD